MPSVRATTAVSQSEESGQWRSSQGSFKCDHAHDADDEDDDDAHDSDVVVMLLIMILMNGNVILICYAVLQRIPRLSKKLF